MPLLVLCAVFLTSGASALVFETVWFFQAGLGFGNGITASSIVLSGFMGGMALGGAAASRIGDRIENGLRAYAMLEGTVAVTGVGLTYLLPGTHHVVAALAGSGSPGVLFVVRVTCAFALLALPSTAIGMTLPVLARTLERRDANFGRVLGLLYGVNTLGAVVGTLATEHFLLEAFGVRGSAWFAGVLDATVAAIAWVYSKRSVAPEVLSRGAPSGSLARPLPPPPSAGSLRSQLETIEPETRRRPWLAAAFASGFLLLGLEVVWLRILALFLNDTPLAFATILALVLGGVAAGGLGASRWAARHAHPETAAPWVAYGTGAACLLGYLAYPVMLERHYSATQRAGTVLAIAAPLVLPACVASGMLYVVLGAGLRAASASHAAAAGRLSFANTLGAALGPLAAGFLLLPGLGMEKALFSALVAYGLLGFGLAVEGRMNGTRRLAGGVAFVATLLFFPFGRMSDFYLTASAARWASPGSTVQAVREGTTATILHLVHRANGAPIFDQVASNAYSMTINDFIGRRYMKLFTLLPEALHPKIRRAAVIGYGIGNTVESLTDDPDVEHIDLADISPDLLAVSRGVVTRTTHPLDDRRVDVHIEDGRYFLATSSSEYDLITGEPPPPVIAGVVALYTREYFDIVRARLAPGGMATYWLPMMNISPATAKSIVAAFCGTFPDCSLWQGGDENLMLFGTRDARGPATNDGFVKAFRDPKRVEELHAIGLELPTQLGALFIGDADYLKELTADAPPLTDDWPKRIAQPGTPEARVEFLAKLRDTKTARRRFAESPFIAKFWPERLVRPTVVQFENERLLDDLTGKKPQWARRTKILHQVLVATPLQLPVLLILKSTPDVQRAMDSLPEKERERPEWVPHRIAAALADRDFAAALELMEASPGMPEILPGLRDYVANAVRHQEPAPEPGAGPAAQAARAH